jgi:hypothetical protein
MKSFSGSKKEIREIFICDELKDRIDFRFSVYRKHEFKEGKIDVLIDKTKILEINDVLKGYYLYSRDDFSDFDLETKIMNKSFIEYGFYSNREFYTFVKAYMNMDIKIALSYRNPIIQFFAIIDKRCGKRTLEKLNMSINDKPDFIRKVYNLRMQAKS